MSNKLKVITTGNRYRCLCCERIAIIIKKSYDPIGYFYEFESELGHLRWISDENASIRFSRIGADVKTVITALRASVKEE